MTKIDFYLYCLILFSPVLISSALIILSKSRNNSTGNKWGVSELIVILAVDFVFKMISIVLFGYKIIDLKYILTYFSIFQYVVELAFVFLILNFKHCGKFSAIGFNVNNIIDQILSSLIILPFELLLYAFYYLKNGYLTGGYYFKFSEVSPHVFFMSLFTILFIGPLAEEVVFRGIAIPAIKKKAGPVWACILTSYMWSIYHPRLDLIITSFILGILYFYLYEKHESLFPSLFAHFLHNLIFVIIALV